MLYTIKMWAFYTMNCIEENKPLAFFVLNRLLADDDMEHLAALHKEATKRLGKGNSRRVLERAIDSLQTANLPTENTLEAHKAMHEHAQAFARGQVGKISPY